MEGRNGTPRSDGDGARLAHTAFRATLVGRGSSLIFTSPEIGAAKNLLFLWVPVADSSEAEVWLSARFTADPTLLPWTAGVSMRCLPGY